MNRIGRYHALFAGSFICALVMSPILVAQKKGQVDTVSGPTVSVAISTPDYDPATLKSDEGHLQKGDSLTWASGSPLFDLGKKAYGKQGSGVATCTDTAYAAEKDRAVIFHVVHWNVAATASAVPQLQSSVWYVYRYPRSGKASVLVPAGITGAGDPLIYGARSLLILNVDIPTAPTTMQSTLKAPVTPGTSDFSTDISALFSALTGISKGGAAAMADVVPAPIPPVFVAVTCEDGTPKLPFSVQIADAATSKSATPVDSAGGGGTGEPAAMAATTPAPGAGAQPNNAAAGTVSSTASGAVSCTGAGNTMPCTMGRTFTSKEHAYIDVSAGIATPGVRDTSFTFSSSATSSGVSSSATRHTDAYALVDLFPLGALLSKESAVPHINFGIPVTSQSLHRPYVGLAENLTGWTHLQKSLSLPVAVNVFGGLVFIKTERLTGSPTTQTAFNGDLSRHWVHKFMIGFEVPISSVSSKFSKSGGSKGASTSAAGK